MRLGVVLRRSGGIPDTRWVRTSWLVNVVEHQRQDARVQNVPNVVLHVGEPGPPGSSGCSGAQALAGDGCWPLVNDHGAARLW